MPSKSKLALITLILLSSTLPILFSIRGMVRASSASTQDIETHSSDEETDGHRQKEVHGVEEPHESAEGHQEAEGHGEESWWRFPGWQIVFAGIASFYFAMVLAWLPLLVAKKGKGEAH